MFVLQTWLRLHTVGSCQYPAFLRNGDAQTRISRLILVTKNWNMVTKVHVKAVAELKAMGTGIMLTLLR